MAEDRLKEYSWMIPPPTGADVVYPLKFGITAVRHNDRQYSLYFGDHCYADHHERKGDCFATPPFHMDSIGDRLYVCVNYFPECKSSPPQSDMFPLLGVPPAVIHGMNQRIDFLQQQLQGMSADCLSALILARRLEVQLQRLRVPPEPSDEGQ